MEHIYSIAINTLNAKAATDSLDKDIRSSNISVALDSVTISGDEITVTFKDIVTTAHKTTLDQIIADHTGIPLYFQEAVTAENYAMSTNTTPDGKILYTKIHGVKANIAAGATFIFSFPVPYGEIYFQGAEILIDIIGVSDFHIWHPVYDISAEQYGYDVNMGVIKYIRESKYAAKIPQGLILRCEYTNDTLDELEVGVNFLMHELRNPV